MSEYLGEFEVTELEGTPFYGNGTVGWALLFIGMYGQIDGAHHKQWALDQVTRILLGTPIRVSLARWDGGEREFRVRTGEPSPAYLKWVEGLKGGGKWDYETGVAP